MDAAHGLIREYFGEVIVAVLIVLAGVAYVTKGDQVLAGVLTTLVGVLGGMVQGRRRNASGQSITAPISHADIDIQPTGENNPR